MTEFEINGEKYGGYIYATTFSEAEDFVRQRKATEKVVGGPCLENDNIHLFCAISSFILNMLTCVMLEI